MASLIAGLVGGLVATIVTTIVMMVMGDGGPPPTARLVAKFAGGEPEDHAMPGMALHFLYGIVAGAVFAVGVPLVGLDFGSIAVAVGLGIVYGVVLMIVGMMFWMRTVIGMEPDRDTMMTFGTAHLVYGVVLGAFLGGGVLA
jgi:predicted MFS family arabinose efflux permease